ncbi:short chain dehydrogenase [Leisingera sp. JC1]|uniref:short chain dehydrogenase n=1 Tax=Leisingera sp. JC1 TaxID=1855282 RepID=UPI00080372AB|nr:short chain dehydrogenase [Leisingera sp. JC1]OBY25153.1 short chain dehydrogenase [Leisingera sp. JC1]
MKILLLGATGTIGAAVAAHLSDHDVVAVGKTRGAYQADLDNYDSLEALFQKVGKVDAVISTAGDIVFGPLDTLTEADFAHVVTNKLLGNMNLYRIARPYIHEGGSFTVTTGVVSREPMPGAALVAAVNGGLESFAMTAATETGRALRVNAVSPRFVNETMEAMGMDSTSGISAADTAKAYRHAVLSDVSGQILDVRDFL